MFPKTCFSIRLAAVAHFDTRRSRWTAFFSNKNKAHSRWAGDRLVKLGVTAQMSARVGASLLEMKPFCRMPRGFLSPVIISRVCLTATSLRSRPAPLIFYFFTLMGKNFLEPEKFFFTRCTCFESNFCPPRFLNLTNSPRLNCKDSPRTSSALALNYAEIDCKLEGCLQINTVDFKRNKHIEAS